MPCSLLHPAYAIPFREIAAVATKRYPRRAALGLSLFVGQAFLYNAVTFDLGTILNGFFDVGSGSVPRFMVLFALSNFLGPLLLGRLFDTVGRVPMIAGTYLGSATLVVVLAVLLREGSLDTTSFMALIMATFFLASAGASSAYLTVSEVFPMETRALAIAFFYAVGTAIGGISGPLLFGHFVYSGDPAQVATGVAELLWGVRAERRSLEAIATPLTATELDSGPPELPESQRAHEDELRERIARRSARERQGARRLRPGPGGGSGYHSPGMLGTAGTASRTDAASDRELDREIDRVARALDEHGPSDRAELERILSARHWARDGCGGRCAPRSTRVAASAPAAGPTGHLAVAPRPRRDAMSLSGRVPESADRPHRRRRSLAAMRRRHVSPDKPWFDLGAARELSRRAAKRARVQIVVLTPLLGGVLALYVYRHRLFPSGWDGVVRILLAVAFIALGWQLAREVGRAMRPMLTKHLEPAAAGTVGFLIRLWTMLVVAMLALRVAGLGSQELAVGGALTAVLVGLAAQQMLGNVIAGARGDRALHGASVSGGGARRGAATTAADG